MYIAIIGAGAIGSLTAAYLKSAGHELTLVGRPDSVAAIRKNGLCVRGARGELQVRLDVSEKLERSADLAILATKTQDLEEAVRSNLDFLECSVVLTTQNGIQADAITVRHLPKENIVSSIVMFGATRISPFEVVHNFEGVWLLGRPFGPNDAKTVELSRILDSVAPTMVSDELMGMKYLKLFVNASNCIPAVLGVSMQEAFADPAVSRISIGMWKEGLEAVRSAGIKLVSLPDFPLERLERLTAMPVDAAARAFSEMMVSLSNEPIYGSILQSIKRARPSEIDYLNGEFVRLARSQGQDAPLNARLVEMVHHVEREQSFFSKEELLKRTGIS